MPQFATSYIQSLAQPDLNRFSNTVGPRAVNVPSTGIETIDVDLPGNDLMATLATNSPALAQYRSLQKKQVLSNMGGPEFTNEDQQKLDQLQQMESDPVNVYSQTV